MGLFVAPPRGPLWYLIPPPMNRQQGCLHGSGLAPEGNWKGEELHRLVEQKIEESENEWF